MKRCDCGVCSTCHLTWKLFRSLGEKYGWWWGLGNYYDVPAGKLNKQFTKKNHCYDNLYLVEQAYR